MNESEVKVQIQKLEERIAKLEGTSAPSEDDTEEE